MRLAENAGCKKSPSARHRTTLLGYIFATKARIDNNNNNDDRFMALRPGLRG